MNVLELIEKLNVLPEEDKKLSVTFPDSAYGGEVENVIKEEFGGQIYISLE